MTFSESQKLAVSMTCLFEGVVVPVFVEIGRANANLVELGDFQCPIVASGTDDHCFCQANQDKVNLYFVKSTVLPVHTVGVGAGRRRRNWQINRQVWHRLVWCFLVQEPGQSSNPAGCLATPTRLALARPNSNKDWNNGTPSTTVMDTAVFW